MSGYTGKDFQGDAMRSGMEHAVNPFSIIFRDSIRL